MAQKSMPWGRSLGADSMVGYTAKEWYSIWGAIAKSGAVVVDGGITTDPATYDLGVFYSIGNKLEVTTPGNARIDVATGAALVEGAFVYNDTAIGAGGDVNVGPASLMAVVRKNYSAVAYVPAVASVALFTVPAYTARVTVIDAASITQDVARLTYWDIPLASFDINAGGVISNWVDLREYADVEIKEQIIVPSYGQNQTDVSDIFMPGIGMEFIDNKVCVAWGNAYIGRDFISIIGCEAIVRSNGAGNCYSQNNYAFEGDGEAYSGGGSGSVGFAAVALGLGPRTFIQDMPLTNIDYDDTLHVDWGRDSTDPLDTVGASVFLNGWILRYWGWK